MGKYADRLPFGSKAWSVTTSDAGQRLICVDVRHLAAGQIVLAEVRPLDFRPDVRDAGECASRVVAVMVRGPELVAMCERLLQELRFGPSSYADRCRLVEEATVILDLATCSTPD